MDGESFCVGNDDDLVSLDAAREALRAVKACSSDDERERVVAAAFRRALFEALDARDSLAEIERESAYDEGYEQGGADKQVEHDDALARARKAAEQLSEALVQP